MNDLPDRLRATASGLDSADVVAESAQHLMRLAADFIESTETAERERLEHEAVSPEIDLGPDPASFNSGVEDEDPCPWPLFPMRELHDSEEAYTRSVVAWRKRVFEIERACDRAARLRQASRDEGDWTRP